MTSLEVIYHHTASSVALADSGCLRGRREKSAKGTCCMWWSTSAQKVTLPHFVHIFSTRKETKGALYHVLSTGRAPESALYHVLSTLFSTGRISTKTLYHVLFTFYPLEENPRGHLIMFYLPKGHPGGHFCCNSLNIWMKWMDFSFTLRI